MDDINACLGLSHFANQLIGVGIVFAVLIGVLVDLEYRTAELVIRVFLVHLGGHGRADDELVLNGNFQNFLVCAYRYREAVLVQHEGRSCLDLTDEPSAVRHILKDEDTVLAGLGSQNSGFLCKGGFLLTEQAEERTHDQAAILVQLLADNAATDDLIGDSFAIVYGNLHQCSLLACVIEGHRILCIREDIVAVGLDFLHIELCAYGDVRSEYCMTVFPTGNSLNERILGNGTAICRCDFLGCIEAKGNGEDFTVLANAEGFVLFHDLGKVNFYLLPFIDEAGVRGGNSDLLSGIGQLHQDRIRIDDHTVGCGNLTDDELAQEQRLGDCLAAIIGGNDRHYLVFGIAERTVRGDDVLGCGDLIDCSGKPLHFIHRLVSAVRLGHRGKDLASLADGDSAFLRLIFLDHLDNGDAFLAGRVLRSHIEIDRRGVQHIAVRGLHLHQAVICAVGQLFRSKQSTVLAGIEGVNHR